MIPHYNNILCTYLKLLHIKFTTSYVMKIYEENPYRYTLYGIYKMLCEYNIDSTAIHLNNKKEIKKLNPPFIVHADNDFLIVKRINGNNIICNWNNSNITMDIDKFYHIWNGLVLVSETNNNSREPKYLTHTKEEFINNIPLYITMTSILCIFIMGLILNDAWNNLNTSLSIITSITGLFICLLLLLKQLNISNTYADKICITLSNSDCNNVLNSSGSSFLGIASWGEIGFGYFTSAIIIHTFFPLLSWYSAIINTLALPYSIWSVWYQKFVVKKWCPLCLIAQLVLWLQFFIDSYTIGFVLKPLVLKEFVTVTLVYILPIMLTSKFVSHIKLKKEVFFLKEKYNDMKLNKSVFKSLLTKEKRYISNSIVRFGNIKSKNCITVLTNPNCEPCATTHNLLEELLKVTNNGFCIQYVFSSFRTKYDVSCKFLIATFLEYGEDKTREIYSEWYKTGKYNSKDFIDKYKLNIENEQVIKEWKTHKEWKQSSMLIRTPTLLFNGYKLPDEYKVMDLKYFSNIDI